MTGREKILILGGTREAARLAEKLVAEGHCVTTSLAGRTKEPEPLKGEVRIGGFSAKGLSGAQGLAAYIRENGIQRLIDATHPFAKRISQNAIEAAKLAGIPLERNQRDPWEIQTGDQWIEVANLVEAVEAIPANARVLLALGSQHIAPFANRKDVFFLVRMVDAPASPLQLEKHELVLGKPSANPDIEAFLLKTHAITHIVCRNSGGEGAYAKIIAARKMGLSVIMIGR